MKTIIIITGHGNYATALKSSIELIAGQNADVYYLDLTLNDTDVTLKEKVNKVITENNESPVLFICDILGGTPFKVSVEVANDSDKMEVVVGCNIGSILEGILQKDQIAVQELADMMVFSSKKTTVRFTKNTSNKVKNILVSEDGI